MSIIRYVFIVIILLTGILFSSLNAESVNMNLYVHVYHLPLSLLVVCVFGLGMFIGYIIGRFKGLFIKK